MNSPVFVDAMVDARERDVGEWGIQGIWGVEGLLEEIVCDYLKLESDIMQGLSLHWGNQGDGFFLPGDGLSPLRVLSFVMLATKNHV